MNKNNIFEWHICWALLILMVFSACNDENESMILTPGARYELSLRISTGGGDNANPATRAQDQTTGVFTDEYDADYVYIHSTSDATKFVKIPVIDDCDGCHDGEKGIEYNITRNSDGGFTIASTDGLSTATFGADEKIYLSSEEYETWEGTSVAASPITGQSVLIRDADKNKEIYRSGSDYTIQEFINLGLYSTVTMERKCSAFRIYFMFTDLSKPLISTPTAEQYYITPENFVTQIGQDPYTFSGKLYIGPYFCDTYNLNTGLVGYDDDHANGYYVTNNQQYTPFVDVSYNRQQGVVGQTYMGYGVSTAASDYLITPYDVNSTEDLTFYAFIKNNTDNPTSDGGSKYVTYNWSGVPAFNTTYNIAVIYDIAQLDAAFSSANSNAVTRSNSAPQKLDIQPVEVICIQE